MVYWYQLDTNGINMSNNLIKISEATSLALHSMIILAQHQGKLVSVKEISNKLDVSANHLSKVMQRLNKAGYIKSIKGYNGGFELVQEPQEISFFEIYELFEGRIAVTNCLLNARKCTGECILGDLISSVNNKVIDKFKQTKLEDFIK